MGSDAFGSSDTSLTLTRRGELSMKLRVATYEFPIGSGMRNGRFEGRA